MKKLSTFIALARVLAVIAFICGPVVFAVQHRKAQRNFRVVREDVLYRSGQLTEEALARMMHDYGIRTVISLRFPREEGQPAPDLAEEQYCKKHSIRYERVHPQSWQTVDGTAPADESVKRFLEIVREEKALGNPMLVHCYAGVHRSGAYCAIYRMEFEGWSNADAIAELKALGYDNLANEEDILTYLESYRPGER